jgi:hypothetical protein
MTSEFGTKQVWRSHWLIVWFGGLSSLRRRVRASALGSAASFELAAIVDMLGFPRDRAWRTIADNPAPCVMIDLADRDTVNVGA